MKYDQLSTMLEPMPNPELEKILLHHGAAVRLEPGQLFTVPGDELSGLTYIAEGLTYHYFMNNDGTEKLLYQLPAGWFFGEICCWTDVQTGVYSRALTKSVIIVIRFDTAKTLFAESEVFRNAIISDLCLKTLVLRNEVETIAFFPVKKRIRRLFLAAADMAQVVDGTWHPLTIRYTHSTMGMIVGASRVTVSKVINELRNEGFLRTVNNKIQINTAAVD